MNIHTVKLLWWTIVVLLLLRNLDFKTLYLHKCEIKSVRKVALGVLWACPLCKKGQNCCYATVYQHKHRVFFFHTTPWKYLDYLSNVPRRASYVSGLSVARLGLNDGARLWISFKHFSKKNPFLKHILEIYMIEFYDEQL